MSSGVGSNGAPASVALFTLTALASILLSSQTVASAEDVHGGTPKTDSRRVCLSDNGIEKELRRNLEAGATLDAAERVLTVNEHNVPTDTGALRNEMRLKNMWHRATYIVVRHCPDYNGDEEEKREVDDDVFLLVQRRSQLKDYCPGRLDPAPGGVVGFGESYRENAEREIQEEMGIDMTNEENGMRRVFTFPYEDRRVRCWGELYECVYRGKLEDIRIQEEEVEEVLRLSIRDVQEMANEQPEEWMPDGLHALRLYLQHRHDRKVQRRLLPGTSSGNLDAYGFRPKPRAIFFDCDDCLYFDGWNVAGRLTAKIDEWCVTKAGLPEGEAYKLYKRHGTALRGLLAEGHMDHCDDTIDAYLRDVHDLPINTLLTKDEELRDMILGIDPSVPKYIFTASVRHHAERCLDVLGIPDLFVDIIDVKACNLATKHSREAFERAMEIAGVDDPEACLFLDDSVKNIRAAREVGWRSVLVGRKGRDCGKAISSEHAEHEINRIHEFPSVYPELFGNRR